MQLWWWKDVEEERKEAVYDSVRVLLLVGLVIRIGLFGTGLTLLVTEGNFLLEWAMSFGLAQRFGVNDLEEVTLGALIVIGLFLVFGIIWRYAVIRRMSSLESRMGTNRREESES